MSWKIVPRPRSLSGRLMLVYALVFGLATVVFLGAMLQIVEMQLATRFDGVLTAKAQTYGELYRGEGLGAVATAFAGEERPLGTLGLLFRVVDDQKQVLAATAPGLWPDRNLPKPVSTRGADGPTFSTSDPIKGEYDVRRLCQRLDPGAFLQLQLATASPYPLRHEFLRYGLLAVGLMVGASLFLTWFLLRRALGDVRKVSQTAEGISRKNLNLRVETVDPGEEIRQLAATFNQMLERIEAAVKELEEVTDNVAHDLRSPVARIRARVETTWMGQPTVEELREMSSEVVEECDRLGEMIQTMLDISAYEAGQPLRSVEPVDVKQIIDEAVDLFAPLAEDRGLTLSTKISGEDLTVLGDRTRLQRAVANLVDNALKYTPAGGGVTVWAREDGGQVELIVQDDGPGIPDADRPHVFQRFYRGDRSRSTRGSGLGLSFVQALVRAHGGSIRCVCPVSGGTTMLVLLPRHQG